MIISHTSACFCLYLTIEAINARILNKNLSPTLPCVIQTVLAADITTYTCAFAIRSHAQGTLTLCTHVCAEIREIERKRFRRKLQM